MSRLLFTLLAAAAVAADRPDVVVILTDDQGWGDLSLHGNPDLRTPHIDSIAKAGAAFDRFYVQPVCSPTRAEFLTGRYHPRGGVRGVSTGGERLDLDETTIADAFRAAGYRTACFGKWHNGSQYPYHPRGRGFDEYYGFTSGHWGDYFDPPLDHNGSPVKGSGFLPDDLTDRAIRYLAADRTKPAFVLLTYNTPHSPMQVPDEYWKRFADKQLVSKPFGPGKPDIPHMRAAYAMCENLDDNVGRLLGAIGTRDAIVAYFHDNGPNGHRFNGGMKGRKGATDEGGVRSPLFVRWPGRINPGTRVNRVTGAIDLLPTLAALADVKPVGAKGLDGDSRADALRGRPIASLDYVRVQHWNGRVSVCDDQHRLDATGKLFDTLNDPGQTKDLTSAKPDIAAKLAGEVERWKKDVLGELPKSDDRPFPVGHAALPAAWLPARDGVPRGGVTRSAQAPNCSFFTTWTKADDAMTWDIEVATAGRYEATIHYTCAAGDVGSAVELAIGTVRWSGTITAAHDPPLRGKENDRVTRSGESYVKEFAPLSLGVVDVAAGRGTLTLRATKVTGKTVADVRGLTLTLKN